MDLASEIGSFSRTKLNHVRTVVTNSSGKRHVEQLNADGDVEVTEKLENGRCFVIDTSPDFKIGQLLDGKLLVGSQDVAANLSLLKENHVTHVLNCATRVKNSFKKTFVYKNINVLDVPECNLIPYFEESNAFIDSAINSMGVCFVHCNAGISRSTSFVVAYLISRHGLDFDTALALVRLTCS